MGELDVGPIVPESMSLTGSTEYRSMADWRWWRGRGGGEKPLSPWIVQKPGCHVSTKVARLFMNSLFVSWLHIV